MSERALRLQLLATRRERLVRIAAEQRGQLAVAAAPLARAWHGVEIGLLVWRGLKRQPWLVALPVVVLALWRPRMVVRALAAAPLLWRLGSAWAMRA
jgi:hypothetical protein